MPGVGVQQRGRRSRLLKRRKSVAPRRKRSGTPVGGRLASGIVVVRVKVKPLADESAVWEARMLRRLVDPGPLCGEAQRTLVEFYHGLGICAPLGKFVICVQPTGRSVGLPMNTVRDPRTGRPTSRETQRTRCSLDYRSSRLRSQSDRQRRTKGILRAQIDDTNMVGNYGTGEKTRMQR